MHRTDFDYDLPEELIAQSPLAERSASHLLVLDRASGALADRVMRDLPQLLAPGDLLVFNDTRVVPARLTGAKATGGHVEILLERALGSNRALVQMRASKPIRAGLEIATSGGTVRALERRDDLWIVETPEAPLPFFERWGEVPLPPYIRRAPTDDDRERYQSIFASHSGAVAAPTASLHFDAALTEALAKRGVARAFITLHVGAGTFQPLRVDDIDAHVMHAEAVRVNAQACDAVARAREAGGRIVAVGTTVARALETAALSGELQPFSGDTDLFIRPGFPFRVIDALLTNFHLPESTLLMLVCAFAGRERVLNAYHHAVRNRYRLFSYGDAMLITAARGS
ncbi:MAG: tRNA preQ1(34) S-adenosylmethionine ribosyltransferase-isomerase QueA [Gammaproteobacteria bacterium]